MAKILLINPPIEGSLYKTPYLGMAYVGASLKKAGHQVVLSDGCLSDISLTGIIQGVAQFRPDFVGVSAFTLQYQRARKIFPAVKRLNPTIVTVFGGPHASALTEYVMKDVPDIDFTIKGEGEEAFPALVAALAGGEGGFRQIPGLAFRENGQVVVQSPQPIEDLDSLEYPWQVVNPLDYAQGMGHGFMARRQPIAPVISSRGCPYKCTFCAGPLTLGRRLRRRSPQKFVDEIQYLVETFGIREVHILDDNFTFYQDHATQICQEILKRGLDITWSLPNGVRSDKLEHPLLALMKKAGCYYMAFGIEFGSERMLRLTKKGLSLEKTKQAVRQAAKLGYITQGFFLIGHPQEKREDIHLTTKLARELPLERISVNAIVPLPGSELFQYYLQKGYLDMQKVDWGQFAGPQYIPRTEFLSHPELMSLLRAIYIRFYLSPRRILRYLLKLRSWSQIKGLWAGVRTLFRSLVKRGQSKDMGRGWA